MVAVTSSIGLLGGSFDPIHHAHLQLARTGADTLGLAQVRFLPAGRPWQKSGLADAGARAAMVQLALDEANREAAPRPGGQQGPPASPRFVLDRRELERPGPTYTIDTLRELRTELGPATGLVLLIGADQLQRLDSWHDWETLLQWAHIAVAPRPGESNVPAALSARLATWYAAHRAEPAALRDAAAGAIVEVPMPPVEVSATEIRALLASRRDGATVDVDRRLLRLLPAPVLDYIRAHRLYASTA